MLTRAARCVAGLVAIVVALVVSGCAPTVDRDLAQQCRIAAAGLATPVRIRITGQSGLSPAAEAPGGVRLAITPEDPDVHLSRLDCRFSGAGPDRDLVSLATQAGPVDDTHLYFLKRFWLGGPEATDADPGFDTGIARLPTLPMPLAFLLQMALDALPNAAVYGLIGAAYSLIYGLHGRINLAFGEIAAAGGLAAVMGAAAFDGAPAALILVVVGAIGAWASGIHGYVAERLVMWRMRKASNQHFLVATVGVALVLQEYLRLATGGRTQWIGPVLAEPFQVARADAFVVTVTPVALLLAAVATLCSASLLTMFRFTRFGRSWRATSDDAKAAALFGVDPRRMSIGTYVIASALVGLAGAGMAMDHGGTDIVYMTELGLKALIAAVVGGIGSVPGAFLGGVGLALIETLWSAYGATGSRDLVVDVLLVAILVLRPGGLFGDRDLAPRRV